MSTMDELVNRFLTWPLPEEVSCDPCVMAIGYPNRTGTNLLTAEQAKQMLGHVLALHPMTTPVTREFCAAYPGTAAGIINALARQIDDNDEQRRDTPTWRDGVR